MEKWISDNGNGTYTNPILYLDYSDPDAVRVGNDFYMTASSFCNTPGLPVLHSRDLVNWELIGYALENIPCDGYNRPRHGCGVWAPAIRYYHDEFYIFYPMPDEGIFYVKAKDPAGKWSDPVCVYEGAGWIDPCPFIDDDGKCYIVNAFAKSRIGFKSRLQIVPMSEDFNKITGDPVMVFDGEANNNHTIEGPKLYKNNSWYYIFAPAGGVKQGWQTVLRSRNIYGPYEYRRVMEQKDTDVNGPHQGAWIRTGEGEDWFIHFQDIYTAGRIVHLQPMRWEDDWPIIGQAQPGETCGKPVSRHAKPAVSHAVAAGSPAPSGISGSDETKALSCPGSSDEFDSPGLSLQWQWNANHRREWTECLPERSVIKLGSVPAEDSISDQPNLLLQKWPLPEFTVFTCISLEEMKTGDEAGIINMAERYGALGILKTENGFMLRAVSGEQIFEKEKAIAKDVTKEIRFFANASEKPEKILLSINVTRAVSIEYNNDGDYSFPIPRENVTFSYSLDGNSYEEVLSFESRPGRWVGAKCGIYVRNVLGNEGGYGCFDYFRFE